NWTSRARTTAATPRPGRGRGRNPRSRRATCAVDTARAGRTPACAALLASGRPIPFPRRRPRTGKLPPLAVHSLPVGPVAKGTLMLRMIQAVGCVLARLVLSLRYRIRLHGGESLRGLPAPVLVLPNHPGYVDPPLVLATPFP